MPASCIAVWRWVVHEEMLILSSPADGLLFFSTETRAHTGGSTLQNHLYTHPAPEVTVWMLETPGIALSARAPSEPGEKGSAATAADEEAEHERASMGTMTGWQALADEVKTCHGHAAYDL